jgi:hypothetical protein
MDILKKQKDIQDLFSLAISDSDVELELIFGHNEKNSPVDKTIFLRLLNSLKQGSYYSSESTHLDIKCEHNKGLSNVRCTIKDLDSIKKYCMTNSLKDIYNIDFIEKSYYKKNKSLNTTIRNTDFNYRLNLKVEKDLNYNDKQKEAYNKNHDSKKKHYRFKKRYSFETPDNLFRIDLTAVKSTSYEFIENKSGTGPKYIKSYNLTRTFKEADILNNPEMYELEIEFIGHENRIVENMKPLRVETEGYSRILNYYNKLEKHIKKPLVNSVDHSYDPLFSTFESVWKPGYIPDPISNTFMKSTVVDVPDTVEGLNEGLGKLLHHKVRVTDDFQHELETDLTDKELLVIDYDENYNNDGKHVQLKYSENSAEKDALLKKLDKLFPGASLAEIDELIKKQPLKRKQYNDIMKKLKPMENIGNIWVPVDYIYSDYLDISEVLYPIVQTEGQQGGGPEWANEKSKSKSKSKSDNSNLLYDSPKYVDEDSESLSFEPTYDPKSSSDKSVSSLNQPAVNVLKDVCIDLLNNHVAELYYVINNNRNLISLTEKKSILTKYSLLTNQQYNSDQELFKQKRTFRLLGPQPVTLNHQHLDPESPINIIHGYAVTEKADGYRAMLFITENRGYLITSKLDVIYTGVKFPDVNGEWLFDGEYITKDKDKNDINLYMIFDVYYNGNRKDEKPAYNYVWHSRDDSMTRSKIIKDFEDKIRTMIINENSMEISFKNYQYGALSDSEDDSLIFEKCKNILNTSSSYRYRIDGLILMPVYTKVKGDKSGKDVKYIGGTWDYNFKWKPPEENTIDFKLSFEKDGKLGKHKIYPIIEDMETGEKILRKYKKASLIVGYDQKQDDTLDYYMMILTNERRKNSKEKVFHIPSANNTNLLLVNNKIICEDESEIKDGDIVEMRYNPNGKEGMIWEPLRVRHDKQDPQFFTIANNVWETIEYPITENVIKGLEPDSFVNEEELVDLYYVGDTNTESKALRDYHNYIKSNLIRGVCESLGKNIQVMDTSIGRGGDIKKYINDDCRISYLLGLDIANINEASKRYYYESKKPLATFIQADTSLNIKSNLCDMGHKHTKIMLDILYDNAKTIKGKYKSFYKNYKGIAKKGFDVINSQFSFHYYLESRETFDGYLMNINDNLNKGGYFIATFYDGMKLYDLLKTQSKIEYNNNIGEKIYSIEKDYELPDFDYREENTDNMFGNKINVFMDSIGQELPEYLVNIEFVIAEMRKIGLELHTPKVKEEYSTIFQKYCLKEEGRGDFESILETLSNKNWKKPVTKNGKTDTDIIKKYYPRLTEMFRNEKLKQLSGLNNYLVFKKV